MANEDLNGGKHEIPVGIISSLIASVLFAVGTTVLGSMEGYEDITPNVAWILLIMAATIAFVLFIQFFLSKKTTKIIDIFYTISSIILFFCVLLFIIHITYIVSCIIIQIQYANNSQPVSMESLESHFKASSAIAMCGCGICITRIYILYIRITVATANEHSFEEAQKSIDDAINSINEKMQSSEKSISSINERIEKVSSEFQKIRSIKGMNSAMTSTIIPFKRLANNEIKTYLIANKAYPEYTWMFPGGHVYFEEQNTPERVAKERARNEAGLDTEIVDIYNSFDIREPEEPLLIDNMNVFYPPHYLNLFKLDKSAKCYNSFGHEYHIDVVYVAEIKKINTDGKCKRIEITLPSDCRSKEDIKTVCLTRIANYYTRNRISQDKQHYELDYVIEMLFWAINDYRNYLEKKA